jgi:hypothetical protein
MNLKSTDYNQQFLTTLLGGQAYNDAPKYGVKIQAAQVADGELYWRVIGVHHLLPSENGGDHTILVEALDEQGNRIRQGKVWAARTWENNADPPEAKALDKGPSDPAGCDFPMNFGQTNSVWIQGDHRNANDPSERVEKIHTRHDDEPDGNTRGHHSFYVAFQRTRKAPTVLDEDAVLKAARKLLAEQVGGDAPFAVYAREHDLGAPITAEFSAGGYRARGYVKGIVFAPIAKPNEIKHMAW